MSEQDWNYNVVPWWNSPIVREWISEGSVCPPIHLGAGVSEFERVIAAVRALPDAGDGMTVGAIADAVGSSTSLVVSALEEIVERDEAAVASEGD